LLNRVDKDGDGIALAIITRFSILSNRKAHSWMRFHFGPWIARRWLPSVFAPIPDIEKRKAYLFAEDRLRFRLRCLEQVLLASLANQSDRGFEHFVLTSEVLPDWAMQRLEALSAEHGFRILCLGPDDRIDPVMEGQTLSAPARRTVTMRIDDDDAIDRDVVRKTRQIAVACADDTVISWTNGFELSVLRTGACMFEPVSEPFRSCALSRVREAAALSPTVYSAGQHHLIAKTNIVHCQPDAGAFLMTNHGDNVSGRAKRRSARPLSDADRALLADRFGISDVQRLLAGPDSG
jgi:hypothetical protein